MTAAAKQILHDALSLSPKERAALVDNLISSLDEPDKAIDDLWQKEIESRVEAYRKGKIGSVSLRDVLAKYQNGYCKFTPKTRILGE